MAQFLWLTAIESAEPIGIAVERIAMIEQKARGEGLVVAIHLDTGPEIRVVESLDCVRQAIAGADPEGFARNDHLSDVRHLGPAGDVNIFAKAFAQVD